MRPIASSEPPPPTNHRPAEPGQQRRPPGDYHAVLVGPDRWLAHVADPRRRLIEQHDVGRVAYRHIDAAAPAQNCDQFLGVGIDCEGEILASLQLFLA